MLKKFKRSLNQRTHINDQWLMQDGAPAHTATATRQWLNDNFGQRIISLKTNFVWAPYAPDLNSLDFYLLGHLKDCVYRSAPKNINELKQSIVQHTGILSQDHELFQRVINNFKKRVDVCLKRKGRHLEHIINKIK